MINDDFDFTFDSSDFPVSIEEFAAYMDGNLSDDEMQRIGSVIENDESMQGVIDSMEQSELTLAEYGQEDMQLPEGLGEMDFFIPETDPINALAIEDYCDTNSFELPPIEEHNFAEESHSDIDYNEIVNDEEIFDADSNNGVNYDEYNDL